MSSPKFFYADPVTGWHDPEKPIYDIPLVRSIPVVDCVVVLIEGSAHELAEALKGYNGEPRMAIKGVNELTGLILPEGVTDLSFDDFKYSVMTASSNTWPTTLKRVYFHSSNVKYENWVSCTTRCPDLPASVEQCWLRGSYPPTAEGDQDIIDGGIFIGIQTNLLFATNAARSAYILEINEYSR